jgi:Fe-S-cluster-containing hydrogenase component 2
MKILRARHMERCIGCYLCSLACARLVHGCLSWKRSGIRIRSSGGISTGFEAQVCLACDPAPCVQACPTEALQQRPSGGVTFDPEQCRQCGLCAEACPVGAIYMDPELDQPIVCLHCGRCVSFCPHGCLEMVEAGGEEDD